MKLDRYAARHITRSGPERYVTAIWITDSLLAESLHRVTCRHRRQGSSVPGPLEARKRATRRKNTSLASSGHGGPPIEAVSLFGPGVKQEWWASGSPEVVAPANRVPTFLPTWLKGKPKAPSLPQLADDLPIQQDSQTQRVPTALQPQEAFRKHLGACLSLVEAKDLVHRLGIDLDNNPTLSNDILQHFLNLKGAFGEARTLMSDSSVNVHGSQCLGVLLDWFTIESRPKSHRDFLYECVRNNLSLGLYTPAEIQLLLDHFQDIKVSRNEIEKRIGETAGAQSWFWMLVRKLEECPVLSLKDLSQHQLKQILELNRDSPFAPCALDTFRLVERHVLGQHQFKVAEACRLSRLLISAKWNSDLNVESFRKVVDLFTSLRAELAAEVIIRLTQQLLSQRENGADPPGVLDKWREILSGVPTTSVSSIVEQRVWKHFNLDQIFSNTTDCSTPLSKDASSAIVIDSNPQSGSQDSQSMHVARREVTMRLWALTILATGSPSLAGPAHSQHVIDFLARVFQRTLSPHQDLLTEFVSALQSLPLPSSPSFLQNIARSPAAGLSMHDTFEMYQNVLSSLSNRPLDLFKEDEMYRTAKVDMRQAMMNMAQQTNSDPSSFLHIAHALIMRDSDSVKMILRILRCNTAMKLALSHVSNSSSQAECTQSLPSNGHDCSMTSDTALRTLNALACSFAISPALTPRDSFRKVHWIYHYIYRYTNGSAVGPQITTALWHSGVTRFRATGTSPQKVRWILRVIREVEEKQAAQELLTEGRKCAR